VKNSVTFSTISFMTNILSLQHGNKSHIHISTFKASPTKRKQEMHFYCKSIKTVNCIQNRSSRFRKVGYRLKTRIHDLKTFLSSSVLKKSKSIKQKNEYWRHPLVCIHSPILIYLSIFTFALRHVNSSVNRLILVKHLVQKRHNHISFEYKTN
jgi:hypothetical protein